MRRLAIFVVLLLVIGIAVCGCTSKTQYTSGDDDPGPTPTPYTPAELTGTDKLEILTHDLEYDHLGAYLVGTAKNIGDSRIYWAGIDVMFYDPQGNLIGNGDDRVQDLDPGVTWKFKVMCYGPEAPRGERIDGTVDSYKIGVSTLGGRTSDETLYRGTGVGAGAPGCDAGSV